MQDIEFTRNQASANAETGQRPTRSMGAVSTGTRIVFRVRSPSQTGGTPGRRTRRSFLSSFASRHIEITPGTESHSSTSGSEGAITSSKAAQEDSFQDPQEKAPPISELPELIYEGSDHDGPDVIREEQEQEPDLERGDWRDGSVVKEGAGPSAERASSIERSWTSMFSRTYVHPQDRPSGPTHEDRAAGVDEGTPHPSREP